MRSALDAGDFAVGLLQYFDLETFALAVAQIHAQQHGAPVLRFGAAGTGLNVEEAVVGIEFAGEHAAEFHVGDQLLGLRDVGGDAVQAVVVVLRQRHLHQFAGVVERLFDLLQIEHDAFQHLAFASQFLGAFAVLPHGRIFGQYDDFG